MLVVRSVVLKTRTANDISFIFRMKVEASLTPLMGLEMEMELQLEMEMLGLRMSY